MHRAQPDAEPKPPLPTATNTHNTTNPGHDAAPVGDVGGDRTSRAEKGSIGDTSTDTTLRHSSSRRPSTAQIETTPNNGRPPNNVINSIASPMSPAGEELPGLPRLSYNPLDYKWKLIFIVTLLVIESALLPIALYYGLLFGTTLRVGLIFAIVTSFFGIVTGIEFGLRCLKMILKGETYRPIGSGDKKWHFDFTHHTLSFGYTVMTGILIGGSIPHNPPVKVLAIPVSLFLLQVGSQLLWSGWMNATGRPAPCKISSVPKGGRVPPMVYTIVEDIIAVDGDAKLEYRQSLKARYEASHRFRIMIRQMNWFWAFGSLADGIGTMVAIWTIPERIAYGVGKFLPPATMVLSLCFSSLFLLLTHCGAIGWASPLIFTIIWTSLTIWWVRRSLRKEKEAWQPERRESLY